MKLKRVGCDDFFSSACLIIDEDLPKDTPGGNMVASILYSPGGNVVYLHKDGYDLLELQVMGEKFLMETLRAARYKVYKATVIAGDAQGNRRIGDHRRDVDAKEAHLKTT